MRPPTTGTRRGSAPERRRRTTSPSTGWGCPLRSGSSPLLLAVLLTSCAFDPVYKPPPGERAPAYTEQSITLPPPPALPPPAAAPDLHDLRGSGEAQTKLRPNDVVTITVREEPELSVARARVT